MKPLTLVFYGIDSDAAKAAANAIRNDGGAARLRHSYAFDGEKEDDAAAVLVLSCVSAFDLNRVKVVYGDIVTSAASGVMPPPPPPPPSDPLVTLPADWRTSKDPGELKQIAAAVSGGRTVENADQAIAVIEAALKARAPQ